MNRDESEEKVENKEERREVYMVWKFGVDGVMEVRICLRVEGWRVMMLKA